ncbi:MAG: hypothetical protein IPO07_24850 [Haliscomenobacter sp.]|nr:hypothetical protein [Haliscomenobacter sp.]
MPIFLQPNQCPFGHQVFGNQMNDPNRWQPLSLDVFIDQSGNVLPINTPAFLSPEWGRVTFFTQHQRLDRFKPE